MSLTNEQYQTIQRDYERIQLNNRHLLDERIAEIHAKLPAYADLEDTIATVSVAKGKELLSGDTDALDTLREILRDLREDKRDLLENAGYPSNYLDPIYTCALCHDTGYVDQKKCTCFRQKETSIVYEQSLLLPMFQTNHFGNLKEHYYVGDDLVRFQSTVAASKNFVKTFSKDYQNLFFYGTVGTGKSFMSCCIAKELIDAGYFVLYFSATNFFELLASHSFNNDHKSALKDMYQDIYSCDLLIIDDLGTELTNTFVTSQLFSCINERHLRKRATIISTNYSLEDIHRVYSDRIFSRITAHFQLCKMTGNDIRLIQKTTENRK